MPEIPSPLSDEAIQRGLAELDGWQLDDGTIRKEFVFQDFVEAFGFMARAALLAERKNHHPDWSNVYKKVVVRLSTHEAGGITQWDLELAAEFDDAA